MPEKQVEITRAHEAERIGARLIEQFHEHLGGARILYLFTNQERTRNLRTVLGTAQKLPALQKFLSSGAEEDVVEGYDFLILLSSDEWRRLGQDQRVALVDHELCHCWADENGAWKIRGHDLEEFHDIVARHGLWKQDVKVFGEVVRQLRLDEAREPVGATP